MQAPAAAAPPEARSHSVVDLLTVVWYGAFALSFALCVIEVAFGLAEVWRLLGFAALSVIAVAALARARRRYLVQPVVEPGEDERSWSAAAGDLSYRERLRAPAAFALVAVGVAAVPWAVFWKGLSSVLVVLVGFVVVVEMADGLAWWQARRDGLTESVAGSRAPVGWWALAALAVGLQLVWTPVVVMASAADPYVLRVLAVPLVNAAVWGWVGAAWSRPWRIDRRLREIPLDWHWRRRKRRLTSLAVLPSWLGLLVVYQPAIQELRGSGGGVFLTSFYWWFVLLGLVWTGTSVLAREVPPATAQEPLSPAASRSA